MSDTTISGKGTIQNGCNHQSDIVVPVGFIIFSRECMKRCVLWNLAHKVASAAGRNGRLSQEKSHDLKWAGGCSTRLEFDICPDLR